MNIEKPPKVDTSSLPKNFFSLLNDKGINEIISYCNANYFYWIKVKYEARKNNIDEKLLWSLLKLSRMVNRIELKFGKHSFNFGYNNKINQILHELDMEFGGIIESNDIAQLSKNDRNYYILSSLQEEAIASSQMEGAATTRVIAKDILRKNEKPIDKNQQMIVNNYETMKYLVNKIDKKLSIDLILDIHRKITEKTLAEDKVGVIRKSNDIEVVNKINGDIIHIPPKYYELNELLENLCDFCNSDEYFIHPIIKAIIIHFIFAFIHPFSDGNGRTARSLVYWYLLKKGYWMTEYISISRIIKRSKIQYEKNFLYTELDNNDLTYFIIYHLDVLLKAKNELKDYINKKKKEQKDIPYLISEKGLSAKEAMIINQFSKNSDKIITVLELQNLFSISNQTARTYLNSLVNKGYLKQIALNKKKAGFILSDEFKF